MRRLGKLGFLLAMGASLLSISFAAIWYESYRKAETLIHDEKYAEALPYLNEAISLKSESSARVRTYGVQTIRYFPYFLLGKAYYNLGRLEEAIEALDEEERREAIQKSASDYAQLKMIRGLVQEALESRASEEKRGKIQTEVSSILDEAGRAEAEGNLAEAIEVVNKALAVAPEDRSAREALARLQEKASQAAEVKEKSTSTATAISTSLEDSGRASEEVKEKTKAAATANEGEGPLKIQVSDKASEPIPKLRGSKNIEASNAPRTRRQSPRVTEMMRQAEQSFNDKNYKAAFDYAERILALEPENPAAARFALESYKALNARLQPGVKEDIFTPKISPSGQQDFELEPGLLVEKIRRPNYDLRGQIYHRNIVEVSANLTHYGSVEEYRARDNGHGRDFEVGVISRRYDNLLISTYSVPLVLQPGLSLVSVSAEAADATNAVVNSEHLVYFHPPLYATTWFLGAMGSLLVVIAAGILGYRHYRRSKMSKRKFNPYVAGSPILQDTLFFGREQLMTSVLQSIHNNSIMLYGERRIGKTSFQHHLKKKLSQINDPKYRFYPVYIDLQGVPQERFFTTLRDEVLRELAPHLEGHMDMPVAIVESNPDYRQLVDDFRRVIKVLEAGRGKDVKLVLQIDEVDQLNGYDPRINQRLRSLFMRDFSEKLVACVSGVAIQKCWEGEGSPWYNFFEEIRVGPLPREDAQKLIEQPVQGIFKYEKDARDRIIAIAGCKPFLIQKICIGLINRMHAQKRFTITLGDVEAVGRIEEA